MISSKSIVFNCHCTQHEIRFIIEEVFALLFCYLFFFSFFFQWNVYHSRASRNREENDETMQQKKWNFICEQMRSKIFISKSHKTMCSEVLSRCGRDTIAIVVFLFIVFCYFEFNPKNSCHNNFYECVEFLCARVKRSKRRTSKIYREK